MRALQSLVSDSMAIDMGSASTIISVRGRGVVVDEPSLVAVDTVNGEVIAIGREAEQKYGREERGVAVIAPLVNGVVADFERTREMLAHFVSKARGGLTSFSRRALMSVFSDVTEVERTAMQPGAGGVCVLGGRDLVLPDAAGYGGSWPWARSAVGGQRPDPDATRLGSRVEMIRSARVVPAQADHPQRAAARAPPLTIPSDSRWASQIGTTEIRLSRTATRLTTGSWFGRVRW